MFYSNEILNFKSNAQLGLVWLAATVGPKSSSSKRLGRREISAVSIQETCQFLRSPPQPLSLRLSASLMVGVSRVYGQQCFYHYTDVQGLCTKITQINSNPSNPESLDLPNHEKKGSNITLKKIDCISAVNMINGGPVADPSTMNFPDFDLTSLLASTESKLSLSSAASAIEIGRRKASLSSLTGGADLRSSSSLQGTDFTSVIPSSSEPDRFPSDDGPDDFFHHEIPLRGLLPNANDRYQFDPARKPSHPKKRKNLLLDKADELMLGKDQLFITDKEMRSFHQNQEDSFARSDPIKEALKLLNNPQDEFLHSNNLFVSPEFVYNAQIRPVEDIDYGFDDGDMEIYRGNESPTASLATNLMQELNLPWSSSSHNRSSGPLFSSNTPLSKGSSSASIASTPSPLLFDELKSISSQSLNLHSTISSNFNSNFSLSKDSFDFFYFLQEEIDQESDWMNFKSLIPRDSNTKAVASRAFHHLLELKTADLIDLKQKAPFAEIKIVLK